MKYIYIIPAYISANSLFITRFSFKSKANNNNLFINY